MAEIFTEDELTELKHNKKVTGTNFVGSAGVVHRALDVTLSSNKFTDSTQQELLITLCQLTEELLDEQKRMYEKMEFFMNYTMEK